MSVTAWRISEYEFSYTADSGIQSSCGNWYSYKSIIFCPFHQYITYVSLQLRCITKYYFMKSYMHTPYSHIHVYAHIHVHINVHLFNSHLISNTVNSHQHFVYTYMYCSVWVCGQCMVCSRLVVVQQLCSGLVHQVPPSLTHPC